MLESAVGNGGKGGRLCKRKMASDLRLQWEGGVDVP
jgi:hypothetical protein